MDMCYLLTRIETESGSPEKPLSVLGHLSYESYWRSKVLPFLFPILSVSKNAEIFIDLQTCLGHNPASLGLTTLKAKGIACGNSEDRTSSKYGHMSVNSIDIFGDRVNSIHIRGRHALFCNSREITTEETPIETSLASIWSASRAAMQSESLAEPINTSFQVEEEPRSLNTPHHTITIHSISQKTGIDPHDVATTLQQMATAIHLNEENRYRIQLFLRRLYMYTLLLSGLFASSLSYIL
ncbi:unnamed protein product [Protopolystoma xenopodis]|uniref:histone acetyltransferase n=1 Tax=Protopolystoma xenopodis TaxID=117903 RepID=A0A448XRZ4_9PLAT|nr:unnamed protein product [Protopolystoma xenopodis]